MYQNCCKKCGSLDLHTEVKGSNTGLYCSDCGTWIKWLGKEELRAFEYSNKIHGFTKEEAEVLKSSIVKELSSFIEYLNNQIDNELCREALSIEDSLVKCAVAHAYEKNKNSLLRIIQGLKWDESK